MKKFKEDIVDLFFDSYSEINCENIDYFEDIRILGVDSIMLVQFLVQLEEKYKFVFSDDFFEKESINMQDIIEYVEKEVGENGRR
jgi:acyl carrier protein